MSYFCCCRDPTEGTGVEQTHRERRKLTYPPHSGRAGGFTGLLSEIQNVVSNFVVKIGKGPIIRKKESEKPSFINYHTILPTGKARHFILLLTEYNALWKTLVATYFKISGGLWHIYDQLYPTWAGSEVKL